MSRGCLRLEKSQSGATSIASRVDMFVFFSRSRLVGCKEGRLGPELEQGEEVLGTDIAVEVGSTDPRFFALEVACGHSGEEVELS